jgi:deoxyadenosine/deoxycytidine kinase
MSKDASHLHYIAVEGPIGVGKTALTQKLTEALKGRFVAEPVEENPFLERFYAHQNKYAFQTQICFLISRYQQQVQLNQQDLFSGVTVCDYLFAKDRIFAYLNLEEPELALYDQIYQLLDKRLATPDLVIYLQARPEILKERIRRRRRKFEQGIQEEYLEALIQGYNKFFFHYNLSPLLVVDTSAIDFVESEDDFNQLLEKIKSIKSGVQHYIPLGSGQ